MAFSFFNAVKNTQQEYLTKHAHTLPATIPGHWDVLCQA
jgi:hypothetical protein